MCFMPYAENCAKQTRSARATPTTTTTAPTPSTAPATFSPVTMPLSPVLRAASGASF